MGMLIPTSKSLKKFISSNKFTIKPKQKNTKVISITTFKNPHAITKNVISNELRSIGYTLKLEGNQQKLLPVEKLFLFTIPFPVLLQPLASVMSRIE